MVSSAGVCELTSQRRLGIQEVGLEETGAKTEHHVLF